MNSTPPLTIELFATMPTVRPSMRPKPTTSSAANSGLISKKLSSSTSPSITSCTSKGCDSFSGTVAEVSGAAGSSGTYVGVSSCHVPGR